MCQWLFTVLLVTLSTWRKIKLEHVDNADEMLCYGKDVPHLFHLHHFQYKSERAYEKVEDSIPTI